ncbi:MAG: BrnA antitoxin family protein [Pseudomonadota bacterium]|nr:BrnA antitoxin family protein [Pseudomonadota bacterium]
MRCGPWLDADVVDWFKQQGDGYQTKINAVLRNHVERKAG